MNKTLLSVFFVSILVAVVGAILAVLEPPFSYIGLAFAGAGVISICVCFLLMLPRREKAQIGVKVAEDMEDKIFDLYEETLDHWKEIKQQIEKYPENLEEEFENLKNHRQELYEALSAKDKAIRAFLSNFHFTEEVDFRSALLLLQDRKSVV